MCREPKRKQTRRPQRVSSDGRLNLDSSRTCCRGKSQLQRRKVTNNSPLNLFRYLIICLPTLAPATLAALPSTRATPPPPLAFSSSYFCFSSRSRGAHVFFGVWHGS